MLSVREKIAYGLGDTASNIVFQTVMMFLAFFYTDIYGLNPAFIGFMFLAVRVIDAVTDPIMGSLADRTVSKYGKFRPYILFGAVPFGILSVLAFTTPDFSDQGKMIYAFVTYTLLMLGYTAVNIPYCALGGVMTADPQERVSLQSYRFVCAFIGGLLVSALTLPLVDLLGEGDKAKGYQQTILLMSIAGVVMFLLCFAGTRERVQPVAAEQSTVRDGLKALWQNDQWRVLSLAALFLLTGNVLKNTMAIYYVKYYLQQPDSITLFITLGMFASMAGCLIANPLAKKVCKIKAYIALQLAAAFFCAASYWVAPEQLGWAFAMNMAWNFCFNAATPLLWAKMADTVDYGEWKTGVRTTGMVYSSIIFFIKMGLAIGGAMAGWLLAGYGYQADVEQTEHAKQGILLSFSLFPAIGSLIVAIVMRHYLLDKQRVAAIQADLQQKAL